MNNWGYPAMPSAGPDPAMTASQQAHSSLAPNPSAANGLDSPALTAGVGSTMPTGPVDVRAVPVSPMTGPEGSQLSIRVTLPSHAFETRQLESGPQFHLVFGSFLVVPHMTMEPPPAEGISSVILTTNVPVLTDLPGVTPENIGIRIQARLPSSRTPVLYNVGVFRMILKNPAHVRSNGTPTGSPDLWNVPQQQQVQPKMEPGYGPMRTQSLARREPNYDPANPYLRVGRYSDQHGQYHPGAGAAGSPNRMASASRPSAPQPPLMINGMPNFNAPALVRAPQNNHPHDVGFAMNAMPSRPRAQLRLQGDLGSMAYGWTVDELQEGRRLVQFWRKQEGTTIHATFRPIMLDQYVKNSIVVSCIFRADRNECYITSVDTILLLEALVASRFSIEEKNRIRRNLEGFHPETVRKHSGGSEDFFKRIMNFKDPKPRTIAKDVKTFSWKVLEPMLLKVIDKYTSDQPDVDSPGMHFAPAPAGLPGPGPVPHNGGPPLHAPLPPTHQVPHMPPALQ